MDLRLSAPAAQRNRQPILEVLRRVLPEQARVLEIASGTGEHAIWLAEHLPIAMLQPSDPDPVHRDSIDAWRQHTECKRVMPALDLDVRVRSWHERTDILRPLDALLCINMIHIAPWEAALGLLGGCGRLLSAAGLLFLYGPYRRHGEHTAASNAQFDAQLRRRDPAWAVRDLETVIEAAGTEGLALAEVIEMPANNLSVVFRRLLDR